MQEKSNLTQANDTYATIDQLNKEIKTRANNDTVIINTVNSLSTNYENYKKTSTIILNNKQDRTDNSLNTTDKTIVGAINEINSDYIKGSELTSGIKENRDDINEIKEDYIKGSKLTESIEQNKNNINELSVQMASVVDKSYIDESITKMINQFETKIYTKFKEANVNDDKYLFDEYDETYWHLFVFEFETITKKKIIGVLERPSNLNSEIPSHNVVLDYSATSSLNLIFTASQKTLEIKNWLETRRKISKITIYRKK
ncbi:hypothetical protein [Spiroplasma platyhelix]|uniref:Uncharacterized protein n=1 Tax=Spiroplasma platyhelix PALS-1 TaxID=1276218 RepID=A0A846TSL3_9MOLU|nr:hypothetical protein [Spiroplasma platyhelix]MBE4704125.1 hypothetical protein [Spiroplasma platyhelix PALS-1]NKE38495.1 hypothetical protein [Spiroplasma platyhelix PALS-1]UJB29383.1 hypothetical protein SPLAT_v1c06190 [Spiroplasma platyhelix PALS-1]